MYNLLIADDEPLMRRGIKKLIDFESLKIKNIFEAENGEQVLEIVRTEEIDIVLLDINMPRLDGLSVAEKLKEFNSDIKIAIVTGYNYFDYAQKAIKIGVEDYILKPISKKDVTEILTKLVFKLKKSQSKELIENFGEKREELLSQRERIEKIIEESYIDINFSLSFLAEKLDLSSAYLSVIFKREFGITFQDYLLKKRMEKAKILLLTTELKNYEIAEKVGIEDSNYFSIKFRKYFGHPPKQYKDMVEKDEV